MGKREDATDFANARIDHRQVAHERPRRHLVTWLWRARSYEDREHPTKPTAARRSWSTLIEHSS